MTPIEFLSGTMKSGKPVSVYMAEMFIKNGYRFNVTGWGFISSGGPLGSFGLEQEEAIGFIENSAYFQGLCDATQHEKSAALEIIRKEIAKIEELAKQGARPGATQKETP